MKNMENIRVNSLSRPQLNPKPIHPITSNNQHHSNKNRSFHIRRSNYNLCSHYWTNNFTRPEAEIEAIVGKSINTWKLKGGKKGYFIKNSNYSQKKKKTTYRSRYLAVFFNHQTHKYQLSLFPPLDWAKKNRHDIVLGKLPKSPHYHGVAARILLRHHRLLITVDQTGSFLLACKRQFSHIYSLSQAISYLGL